MQNAQKFIGSAMFTQIRKAEYCKSWKKVAAWNRQIFIQKHLSQLLKSASKLLLTHNLLQTLCSFLANKSLLHYSDKLVCMLYYFLSVV